MRIIRSVSLGIVMLWVQACGSAPQVDGMCTETLDCATDPNFSGVGAECWRATCKCPGLFDVPCCPDGSQDTCANEEYACRHFTECVPKVTPVEEPPQPECDEDRDCGEPDPWCGQAACIDGACSRDFLQWEATSHQRPGDCAVLMCDEQGKVFAIDESSDWNNDGNPCTIDYCGDAAAVNAALPDESSAPDKDVGLCVGGAFVECNHNPVDPMSEDTCPLGTACQWGAYCTKPHCHNGITDAQVETGYNCGGECAPCEVGSSCVVAADCQSNVCIQGLCVASTHDDKVKNDGEAGTDCAWTGAPPEARCPDGETCTSDDHCKSEICFGGACQAPTCEDATTNGGEEGPDCGGPCPSACAGGK